MGDRGVEFIFFQDVHVKTEARIDITIPIKTMTTKFDEKVHLGELTQMRLIK